MPMPYADMVPRMMGFRSHAVRLWPSPVQKRDWTARCPYVSHGPVKISLYDIYQDSGMLHFAWMAGIVQKSMHTEA